MLSFHVVPPWVTTLTDDTGAVPTLALQVRKLRLGEWYQAQGHPESPLSGTAACTAHLHNPRLNTTTT